MSDNNYPFQAFSAVRIRTHTLEPRRQTMTAPPQSRDQPQRHSVPNIRHRGSSSTAAVAVPTMRTLMKTSKETRSQQQHDHTRTDRQLRKVVAAAHVRRHSATQRTGRASSTGRDGDDGGAVEVAAARDRQQQHRAVAAGSSLVGDHRSHTGRAVASGGYRSARKGHRVAAGVVAGRQHRHGEGEAVHHGSHVHGRDRESRRHDRRWHRLDRRHHCDDDPLQSV